MPKTTLLVVVAVLCSVTILVSSAVADSIELRDGRHLQGKYLGGTTTAVGFMTDKMVEYFPISNVLVLIFDNSSVDYRPSDYSFHPAKAKRAAKRRRPAGLSQVRLAL